MTHLTIRNDRTLATSLINPQEEGILSLNAGNPKAIDITAFHGLCVDAHTDPAKPTVAILDFPAQTEIINTTSGTVTFVYVGADGDVIQETTLRQGAFLRDHISLGVVQHEEGGDITTVTNPTQVSPVSLQLGFADLSTAMTPIDTATGEHNIVSGKSGTLEVQKTAGEYYNHAFNARNADGNKNPNFIESPAIVSPFLAIGWRSAGSAGGIKAIIQKEMLTLYDDGTAVDADALPQGVLGDFEWTNHRIHEAANQAAEGLDPVLLVEVGQTKYTSKLAALHGLQSEVHEDIEQFRAAPAIAVLTIRGGATDLTDDDDRSFIESSKARAQFK